MPPPPPLPAFRRALGSAGLLAALLFAGLLAGGCQGGPSPAAEFVAQAEQLHQGRLASAVTGDKDLNEYFGDIGRRVIAGATAADPGKTRDPVFTGMRFHLVGSETVNAFTTGGGHVYIYNGLFQLCAGEEELAAVMAHEFAHAVNLDVQKTGMKILPGATIDRVAYQYVAYPFAAAQETEADALAFTFYARGGWDPAKFGDVFDRLQARARDLPPAGKPSPAARAAAARAAASGLPPTSRNWRQPTVADVQSFKELRARANNFDERADPLNRAWLYLRAFPTCFLPAEPPEQRNAQEQLRRDITPVNKPPPEPS